MKFFPTGWNPPLIWEGLYIFNINMASVVRWRTKGIMDPCTRAFLHPHAAQR